MIITIDAALISRSAQVYAIGHVGETCAVALAIKDQAPSLKNVWVTNSKVGMGSKDHREWEVELPHRLRAFIRHFDYYMTTRSEQTRKLLPDYYGEYEIVGL